MIIDIVWLIVGLVLILTGANFLTDGASAVAKKFGITDLVIGLTVVAFGTSAPELVISVMASADGNPELAVGNVIGSNIFNILAIIGITAMVRPIAIKKSVMTTEIPMVVLSSVIILILGSSVVLDHTQANIISRVEGLLLLIFFLLFMRYTFATARNTPDAGSDPQAADTNKLKKIKMWQAIVFIIGGLAALIWGGNKFVQGASAIASGLGVSEAVIGLTIVAIGTSLPELATSIVAALKNEPGLAIGNVIGSNIFNIFMVLGTAAVVKPLPFGNINYMDLWVLTGASLMFMIFGWFFKKRIITRAEGTIMAICYILYMSWLVINA
jgi:K+-dependent Na+/Ca+ exchanger family protein